MTVGRRRRRQAALISYYERKCANNIPIYIYLTRGCRWSDCGQHKPDEFDSKAIDGYTDTHARMKRTL